MKRRNLLLAALSLLSTLSTLSARAQADRTIAVRPPHAATCVNETELTRFLSSAGLRVRLRAEASEAGSDEVTVTTTGRPEALHIALRGPGLDVVQQLSPTSCEAAADVVAAFVVSVLAKAPTSSSTRTDASAQTSKPSTRIPERSAEEAALRAKAIREEQKLKARSEYLQSHLALYGAQGERAENFLGAAVGTLGLIEIGLASFSRFETESQRYWTIAALSPAVIGGFGSYALPRSYRQSVALGGLLLSGGATYPASLRAGMGATRRVIKGLEAAGYVGAGMLVLMDPFVGSEPVSGGELLAHHRKLERMSQPSEQAVREAEAAYARTDRILMSWPAAIPLALTGTANIAIALHPDTPDLDRDAAAVLGGVQTFFAGGLLLWAALVPPSYTRYRKTLREYQLLPGGPEGSAGFMLNARF